MYKATRSTVGAGGCGASRESEQLRAAMKNGAPGALLLLLSVFFLRSTTTAKGLGAHSGKWVR